MIFSKIIFGRAVRVSPFLDYNELTFRYQHKANQKVKKKQVALFKCVLNILNILTSAERLNIAVRFNIDGKDVVIDQIVNRDGSSPKKLFGGFFQIHNDKIVRLSTKSEFRINHGPKSTRAPTLFDVSYTTKPEELIISIPDTNSRLAIDTKKLKGQNGERTLTQLLIESVTTEVKSERKT